MRAVGYIRVSTDEQIDGYSLSAQEKAIRDFASLRGWQVKHIYIEAGVSAKDDKRPEFQKMIEDAKQKHFDVIIVHKLDRFSRSLVDMLSYMNMLNESEVGFVSVTEDFDFSTPMGKLMLAMLGAFSQWYLDNLAAEVSKSKKERARKGGWNGTLSYGYTTPQRLRDKLQSADPDDKRQIETTLDQYPDARATDAVPCPFDSPAVQLAFEAYATSAYSDHKIAQMLNIKGYRITSRKGDGLFRADTVKNILLNRFYIGETSYGVKVQGKDRQWMPGNHEPIISIDLFEAVQDIRAKRARKYNVKPHQAKRVYPLSSILYSVENGQKWKGNVKKGKRRYHRTKTEELSGKIVYAENIENQVGNFLKSIELIPSWRDKVIELEQPEIPQYELDNLKLQLSRLKDLFVMGDIEKREYMKSSNALKQQIRQIEDTQSIDIDRIIHMGELIENISNIWDLANLEEKQKLSTQLFSKIYLKDVTIIAVEPTNILWHLLQEGFRDGEDRERFSSWYPIVPYGISADYVLRIIA